MPEAKRFFLHKPDNYILVESDNRIWTERQGEFVSITPIERYKEFARTHGFSIIFVPEDSVFEERTFNFSPQEVMEHLQQRLSGWDGSLIISDLAEELKLGLLPEGNRFHLERGG